MKNLPGVHPAPNIQSSPETYEIENRALDPERRIEAAIRAINPWDDKVLLDLGAGTGYYVPYFHADAAHVIAMEPDDVLRLHIMARIAAAKLPRCSVMSGSAAQIPLPAASVDIVHARFAYFFAPHCQPGLAELARVLRPGGTAFIIDNDLRTGTFAAWLQQAGLYGPDSADAVEGFWAEQGFPLTRIASSWEFASRADLEAVVRLEFAPQHAAAFLAAHEGLRISYHYALYSRTY